MRWQSQALSQSWDVLSQSIDRLSQPFEGLTSFLYIERVISLMKMIVFNSIQVTNYWFTLHRALRPLYQQAQTSSSYIWGISDQNVTTHYLQWRLWVCHTLRRESIHDCWLKHDWVKHIMNTQQCVQTEEMWANLLNNDVLNILHIKLLAWMICMYVL